MWSGGDSGAAAVRREGIRQAGAAGHGAGWWEVDLSCPSARPLPARVWAPASGLGGETGGGSSPRFLEKGRWPLKLPCASQHCPRPTPFVAGIVGARGPPGSPRRCAFFSTGLSRRRAGGFARCCDS